MTFSNYRSVRRVAQTTLLLAGLSLAVSPELLAEESPEEQSQEAEDTINDASPETSNVPSGGLNVAATSMGVAGGVVGGWFLGFTVCSSVAGGIEHCGESANSDAILLTFSALGAIAGGYRGYKNGPILISGGALAFGGVTGIGLLLGSFSGCDSCSYLAVPGSLLAGTAGGYLGYRIRKARESTGNYAIIPTIAPSESGLRFVGQF